MGNAQHKYVGQTEAVEFIGQKEWNRIKTKLERGNASKSIDLRIFGNILKSKFDSMVCTTMLLNYEMIHVSYFLFLAKWSCRELISWFLQ